MNVLCIIIINKQIDMVGLSALRSNSRVYIQYPLGAQQVKGVQHQIKIRGSFAHKGNLERIYTIVIDLANCYVALGYDSISYNDCLCYTHTVM